MSEELYRKYRPKAFKQVLGQEEVVNTLLEMSRNGGFPHAIALIGPTGCGKTTIARIIGKKLGCVGKDFNEINAADNRGIDTVREIRGVMGRYGLHGETRVCLLDEAHKLTPDAQTALLKMLEDPPEKSYYILCTTDAGKLIPTVRGRCMELKLKSVPYGDLVKILSDVAAREGMEIQEGTVGRIAEVADGSARRALVILHRVSSLKTEEERLAAIDRVDEKYQAISLARALIERKSTWADVSKILSGLDDDPEGVRHLIMAYCASILLRSDKGYAAARAAQVMTVMQDNLFDSKKNGLILRIYELFHMK